MSVRTGGLVPFSLCDFPKRVAAVVFTQGCNFRCPFCHNGALIPGKLGPGGDDEGNALWGFLEERRRRLDGIVVSGGEPTLQPDLPAFLRRIKAFGYEVKLDTNGSRPEVLTDLFQEGLVDFVAMDVKAPMEKYARLAGRPVSTSALEKSIALISGSGVEHEFRTTYVRPLLTDRDIDAIRDTLPATSPFRVQEFRAENALDPRLRREAG